MIFSLESTPSFMTYLVAFISAVVTGLLFAAVAFSMGVHQGDVLFALGVVGGGVQWIILIGWYLYHARNRSRSEPE